MKELPNRDPQKPSLLKKSIRWAFGFLTFLIVLGVGVGIYLSYTSYLLVEPTEQVVVLRFGKYHRTLSSGLHFKFPDGIEQAIRVNTQTKIAEFGFRTIKADVKSDLDKNHSNESLILTGDLNMADIRWALQYKVIDPYKFLFRVRNVTKMVEDICLSAIQGVVGDMDVTSVITIGRLEMTNKVSAIIQKAFDEFETGLVVETINIRDANPPDAVKDSFHEVNKARQERETAINEAWGQYSAVTEKAKGLAKKKLEEAQGYYYEKVNIARGEANSFLAQLHEYEKSPMVIKQRLYFETLERVFKKSQRVLVSPSGSQSVLPVLPLDQLGVKK